MTRWIGRLALALAFVVSWTQPAWAAAPGGRDIALCVLPAATGMTPAALFARPDRFECATPQRFYGPGNFWVISAPLSGEPVDVVRSASVWQDRVTLHILYADGAIRRTGFTSATTSARMGMGTRIELPVSQRAVPAVRLLWHVEGAGNLRGIILGANVGTAADSRRAELALGTFYAAFAGLIGGLLIYNLALLVALRQAFQAAYCGLLASLLAYAASTSGMLSRWLPLLDNNDRLRLNAILLAICASSVLMFARYFFERRVFAGWLGLVAHGVIAGLLVSNMAFAVLAPRHILTLDHFVTASYVLLILLVPAVLIQAWRQRSNYLWLFAIAWGVPIVCSGLRVAHGLGWIGWSFWLDQSTIMSMGLEALLSSIGIAYRLRLLQRQRDHAREQELVARALADADPLTGLLNRRAFLHQAIGQAGEQTLLIADLDHFKGVNETIGHDGGDEVLRSFARTLVSAVPAGALVARLGGEEFAVVAPADAGMVPGAILHALRSARMPYDMRVTTSIGTCSGPLLRETDWKSLYRQADRALYAAKAAGRDRARDAATLSFAA
ncbi:diguanylate cyclase [Sphingomonas sp. KR1UV-12]|uniref:diguanylate cyclase n=1 Tax=Sphingomonas aurea TaxID=3063994 RepID=A0ABT9EFH1_9SPHN|nr:diguanylate cyclase [Sphingomonas sp. KR1UV-12]MDP1025722.1 diguanylate cyclase [Sphingomonas sp. KR1UV-12]